MRLTLRTLLAYLDDTLDPSQAREIGQKVAESHVAQELIERIKKVTRRRGLTIPPAAGPDKIDANIVAEYLDNDLPSDKVAEVEEHALGADVALAEIAACHQILALVLGEPAHVPPTARQRMYQLVKGREAIHGRRARRVGPTYPGEAAAAEDLRAFRHRLVYLLGAAVVLGIGLSVALWHAMQTRIVRDSAEKNRQVASKTQPPEQPTAVTPENQQPKSPDTEKSAAKPPERDKAPPMPPVKPPDAEKPAPPKPPEPPPIPKPSTERKEIGKFASREKALLRRDVADKPWTRVAPDARVSTAVPLLSLPGSANEVRLDSGAVLTVWGNLPDLVNWPVLETQVTLHAPPDGIDLDLTLDRGRVYLASTKNGPTKAIVRFADQAWELTLADEKSEVLLESVTSYAGEPFRRTPAAEGAEPPLTQVTLGVTKGKATVRTPLKEYALTAPPGDEDEKVAAALSWDSKAGLQKEPLQLSETPAFWAKAPARPLPVEKTRQIEAAQKKLSQRLSDEGKSVELALAEMAEDPAAPSKVLGAYCQGALDMLPPLIDDLEDPGIHELRLAAIYSLQRYIARAPGNDLKTFKLLQEKKGYSEQQAETALMLLHGFAEPTTTDPATYQTVIAALSSDRVGIRELAIWRLAWLDPEGAARINFRPGETDMNRERAIAEWKRRIPEGKLPPGKNGTQSRAPSRPPARALTD
jgi:hypothetical protein